MRLGGRDNWLVPAAERQEGQTESFDLRTLTAESRYCSIEKPLAALGSRDTMSRPPGAVVVGLRSGRELVPPYAYASKHERRGRALFHASSRRRSLRNSQ